MSADETASGQQTPGVPLRDGRTLRVDAQGIHVDDMLYALHQIQDARLVSPEPTTIGLRIAGAGLVTLVPVRPDDADVALDQLFVLRPDLRPAGYVNPTLPQFTPPPLDYLPPPLYGAPPLYPTPGYPPAFSPPPMYGPPLGVPGYPPPATAYLPVYGPPPAYPTYPVYPPMGSVPGSPGHEGGIGLWPKGIGEVLGTGFQLYFKRFGSFLLLGLVAGGLPALLAGALQIGVLYAEGYNPLQGMLQQLLTMSTASGNNFTNSPLFQWLTHPTPATLGVLIGGGALWLVVSLLLNAWSIAALSLGARDAIAGRPVRVGAALGGGLRRMWSVLVVQLLVALMVIGICVVFFGLLFLLAIVVGVVATLSAGNTPADSYGSQVSSIVFTFGGFCLVAIVFIAVYLYFYVRVFVAQYAAAADHIPPFEAFGRSWLLTWKNWWRTFLPLLLVYVATYILSYVAGVVQYLSIICASLIAVPLVAGLTAPLIAVMALTIYYNLRLRREGYPALAHDLGLSLLPPPPPPPPTGPAQPVHPDAG
jgi:hypothetical protein